MSVTVTAATLAAAFVAGLVSSAGPCVAPRYLILGALTGTRTWREDARTAALFVSGLACVYAAFGAAASWLAHAIAWSTPIYVTLAATLTFCGLRSICTVGRECRAESPRIGTPAGSAFVLGASSALVISPCCMPFVLGAVSAAAAASAPFVGAAMLATFSVGHAVPLVAASAAFGCLRRYARYRFPTEAGSVVNGGLMLALGMYYAVLA